MKVNSSTVNFSNDFVSGDPVASGERRVKKRQRQRESRKERNNLLLLFSMEIISRAVVLKKYFT